VPLAAVVFVAESTGRAGFVVPGLIAAATSQLLMGRWSVSPFQQESREGLLQHRLRLPISAALRTDAITVPPDATVAELFTQHVTALRLHTVPVVDGSTLCGIVTLDDVLKVPGAEWAATDVRDVMRTDQPIADMAWTLEQAVDAIEAADIDRLPVVDGDAFVGMVTMGEILKLDAILERSDTAPLDL
jgi:CBS domain-containing protein